MKGIDANDFSALMRILDANYGASVCPKVLLWISVLGAIPNYSDFFQKACGAVSWQKIDKREKQVNTDASYAKRSEMLIILFMFHYSLLYTKLSDWGHEHIEIDSVFPVHRCLNTKFVRISTWSLNNIVTYLFFEKMNMHNTARKQNRKRNETARPTHARSAK